ncbi:MAG: hypothetical protein QXU32_01625 [Nitrososphaerales archaeon]
MPHNVVIRGLSGRGFRVRNSAGTIVTVKENQAVTVDLENEATRRILSRERDNFIRVANTGDSTPRIKCLNRQGFRIRNNAGNMVRVRYGDTNTHLNVADPNTRRTLRRQKRDWIYIGASETNTVDVYGLDSKPFYIKAVTAAAVPASLTTNLTGTNNDLEFTAVTPGAEGNQISIAYIDPGAANQSLTIQVSVTDIVVRLATNAGGTITSTANSIATAINGHAQASLLVSAANAPGNDGTGVVTAMSKTFLTGGANAIVSPLRVVENQQRTVDIADPFNAAALRRNYRAWVEA